MTVSGTAARRRGRRAAVLTALLAVAVSACGSQPPIRSTVAGAPLPAATGAIATGGPRALLTATGAGSPAPAACHEVAPAAHAGQPATGTVYYDMNQNGQQDPGEPGLAGIPLYLTHGPDSETPGTEKSPATCTDADGRFTLTPPDTVQGWRIEVRTGWFRSQCPGLTCAAGGPGNDVAAGPEWIYTDPFTGAARHVFDVGLIPDAGQYVTDIHAKQYTDYPPDLSRAHAVDLAVRFTDDETTGCRTTTNGVSCHIGQTMAQTLYIANSGLSPVTGIRGVMQLPWGEVHRSLQLLHSGTSPGITALSDVRVTPATGPRQPGHRLTPDNFTTITFTIQGTIPPAGFIAVMSQDTLTDAATPGTQIIGRAGITAEDHGGADTDSAFCPTPAVPSACAKVSDTHSFLDLVGDDNDSDRFNVLA